MKVFLSIHWLFWVFVLSFLVLADCTPRNDTIRHSIYIDTRSSFIENADDVPKLIANSPQVESTSSQTGVGRSCFYTSLDESLRSLVNFKTIFPYITIVYVVIALILNPMLIFKFIFLHAAIDVALPTFLCSVSSVMFELE